MNIHYLHWCSVYAVCCWFVPAVNLDWEILFNKYITHCAKSKPVTFIWINLRFSYKILVKPKTNVSQVSQNLYACPSVLQSSFILYISLSSVYHLAIVCLSSAYRLYTSVYRLYTSVYRLYTSVYCLYIVCITSVYRLFIVCILSVYCLYNVCMSSVYRLYNVCMSSVYRLYNVCTSSV